MRAMETRDGNERKGKTMGALGPYATKREACMPSMGEGKPYNTSRGTTNYVDLSTLRYTRTGAWAVLHIAEDDGSQHAAIAHVQIDRGPGGYYAKPMSEFEGPCDEDCPAELLAMVPLDPRHDPDGYAADWRARCADYQRLTAKSAELRAALHVGTIVQLSERYCNERYTIVHMEGRIVKGDNGKGKIYRLTPACLRGASMVG